MKKNILFIILFLQFEIVLSQTQHPIGLYKGFSETDAGYFYFKKDSTFLFCSLNLNDTNPYENKVWAFNDTIITVGIGKWSINSSSFTLEFQNFPFHFITGNCVKYESSSKEPFDSLTVEINVANKKKELLSFATVNFLVRNKSAVADKYGSVKVKLPLEFIDSPIEITSLGYESQIVNFNPRNNFHKIDLTLTPEAKNKFSTKSSGLFQHNISSLHNFFTIRPFQKDDKEVQKIRDLLKMNIKWFPERKEAFYYLLKMLVLE